MYKNLYTIGLVLFIVLAIIWSIRYLGLASNDDIKEGFSQSTPYVLRENNAIYDSFYLDYYDEIHASEKYSKQDVETIIQITKPNETKSSFLDVGCGTGHLMRELENRNYVSFGVDISPTVVEKAKNSAPDSEIQCADVTKDPMLYENNSFTHITCTHFTLYEIENKRTFMRHCYFWLQCGGYLILHCVEPSKYKKTAPIVDLSTVNPSQKITKLYRDNYDYIQKYIESGSTVNQIETFTDKITGHVRQNEKQLYMEPKEDIVKLAKECGFVFYAESQYKDSLNDEYQYLVILVKPMCGDN